MQSPVASGLEIRLGAEEIAASISALCVIDLSGGGM
jgi:hypothetical protein